MGVYLYTLRKSKPINTPLGTVYRYEYKARMAKYDYWCDRRDEFIDAYEEQAEQMSRIADRFGCIEDCLVCIAGKEGVTVYRQNQSCPIWYDCNNVPGTPVGVLRKRKNRWYVSSIEEERSTSMGFLGDYAQRNGFVLSDGLSEAYKQCYEHFVGANLVNGWLSIKEHNQDDHEKLEHACHAEYLSQ